MPPPVIIQSLAVGADHTMGLPVYYFYFAPTATG
jgi:hypothetical protein